MTDKERIEKFLITLKHLDNCLTYIGQMYTVEEIHDGISDMKESIQHVIDANADQIEIEKL